METQKSEYGKGFIYNLILFAKHYEKYFQFLETNNEMAEKYPETFKKNRSDLWFNGAGDHFFEFELPEIFKKNNEIVNIALELQDEALKRRLSNTTLEEFKIYWEKFERFCILIDKELGLDDIEADWN